jgi:hypothetical protein|tara:strand:+ start:882 stop:2420 length:1539 start_codon:yes stop_codon:yes gene_type:complete
MKINRYNLIDLLKQDFFKSQIIMLCCSVLLISTSSCSVDFIEVAPEDRIDTGAFFSNSDELVFAVNGVYASQRGIYGGLNFYNLQETRSDNVKNDGADQRERVATDTFEENTGNLLLVDAWVKNYILINNANTVLARAPSIPFDNSVEEGLINRSIGETKFIRAMAYFTLVTMYGEVPLRLDPTTDFNNANLPRSSIADVYAAIVSDLNAAISSLPDSYTGGAFNEVGRVTKFAAQTLLAKVQLQKGNKAEASSTLQNVIGKYSLLANYADIHAAGNDNSAESVFEITFNPSNQTGLGLNNLFIPSSEASRLGISAGGFAGILPCAPTIDVTNMYEVGDLRAAASYSSWDNNGNMETYISKFIDLAAAGSGSNINLVVLRYADVLLMKAEADGENAASYELINQVRRRAFGQDSGTLDSAIDISAASPGTFSEKLMLERRREFVFEGHRWMDLIRLPDSEALTIINAHMVAEYSGVLYGGGVPNVDAHSLIYPIPQTEIDVANGVVTQNPGY